MGLAEHRQAGVSRVHEDDAPVIHDANLVGVDIARGVGDARNEMPVGAIERLAGRENVFKAPELKDR